MSEKTFQTNEATPVDARGGRREAEEAEVIDLGRASERTRGSFTGFVIEPSSFPLREV